MLNTNFFVAFIVAYYLFCIPAKLLAQGCSDVGFCTFGKLQIEPTTFHKDIDNNTNLPLHHQVSISTAIGEGDNSVLSITPSLQYEYRLNSSWQLQIKGTMNYADGNLGTALGLGDLFISGTYNITPHKAWQWSVSAGAKIALNKANLRTEDTNTALPMAYQSSLGTNDWIIGLSAQNKHWQFAAGWQQPLTKSNDNEFLSVPLLAAFFDYPPSRNLGRRADILLRAAYKFNIGQFIGINVGTLVIYHVANDEYSLFSLLERSSIEGSSGLTLNMTAGIWCQISPNFRLGAVGGVPLLLRHIHPDGLMRSFVFSPELSILF